MQREYNEYLPDYDADSRVAGAHDMWAKICMNDYYDMHDEWSIVEKEVDFDDMYIVTKDFVNCYVEDTQQWAGTHEAAVFTKAQADALVKSERDKYNLHGVHGACAFKLTNIQSQLVEEE